MRSLSRRVPLLLLWKGVPLTHRARSANRGEAAQRGRLFHWESLFVLLAAVEEEACRR